MVESNRWDPPRLRWRVVQLDLAHVAIPPSRAEQICKPQDIVLADAVPQPYDTNQH